MKKTKIVIPVLSVVLLVSIILNIVQFINQKNEFREVEEQYMVQVNRDIKDTYDSLDSFITGDNRSEIVLHGITCEFEMLHSLLISNYYLPVYSENDLNFMLMGRYLYAEGWISGPKFNATFPGIYSDGVVSDDEIAFLKVLINTLKILTDNACLEVRVFNEVFIDFNKEWERLPLELLEEE